MKKMQNEPNFKNTQINLTSVTAGDYTNFHPLERRKNEPNFIRHSFSEGGPNPIFSKGLSSDQIEQKMQNEPNLQNAQINLTTVQRKDYMKNHAFAQSKNEPNFLQNEQ